MLAHVIKKIVSRKSDTRAKLFSSVVMKLSLLCVASFDSSSLTALGAAPALPVAWCLAVFIARLRSALAIFAALVVCFVGVFRVVIINCISLFVLEIECVIHTCYWNPICGCLPSLLTATFQDPSSCLLWIRDRANLLLHGAQLSVRYRLLPLWSKKWHL